MSSLFTEVLLRVSWILFSAFGKEWSIATSIDKVIGNDDLLIEILLRLPTKYVLRSKSVSKQWKSLISTSSFHILHTLHHGQHSKPRPSFILKRGDSKFFICRLRPKRLVPLDMGFKNVEILQSCNGLMLLHCGKSAYGPKDYYIFNPTTKQHRKLVLKKKTSRLCLVFDPSKSPHYKVVCFRTTRSFHWTETYDSSTHTWKRGVEFSLGPKLFQNAICWNEEIYYIRPLSASYRFVLGDKFYKVQGPPSRYCLGSTTNYMMESNGHMHCISLTPRPDKRPLTVREMDKTNLNWFVKYRITFHDLLSPRFYTYGPVMDVLGIIRGKKEEDSALLFAVPKKILIYRFYEKSFKKVVNTHSRGRFESSHPFIETLVPV